MSNIQVNKNKAFTLAEVLITLGIIGIIAALTIPQMMVKYQKEVTSKRLKKLYVTTYQALNKAKAEDGVDKIWDTALLKSLNNKGFSYRYTAGAAEEAAFGKELDKLFKIKKHYPPSNGGYRFQMYHEIGDAPNIAHSHTEKPYAIMLYDGTAIAFYINSNGRISFFSRIEFFTDTSSKIYTTNAGLKPEDYPILNKNLFWFNYSDLYGVYADSYACSKSILKNNWKIEKETCGW